MVIGYPLVMSGPQKIVKWQVHVVGGKMLEEGIPPVPFCGFLVNPRIHFLWLPVSATSSSVSKSVELNLRLPCEHVHVLLVPSSFETRPAQDVSNVDLFSGQGAIWKSFGLDLN